MPAPDNTPSRVETDPTEFINDVHGGAPMTEYELAYVKAWEEEAAKVANEIYERVKDELEGQENGN